MTNSKTKTPYSTVAKRYINKGYSVIPIEYKSKSPQKGLLQWQKYSETKAPLIATNNNEGIGLVLGKSSGVIGLDFDHDVDNLHSKIRELLGDTHNVVCKKGSKGFTSFFKYNGEKNRSWNKDGKSVIELLSDKRYTVMPPSIHPETDKPYYYTSFDELVEIDAEKLPSLPVNFVEVLDKLFNIQQTERKEGEYTCTVEEIKEALKCIPNEEAPYEVYLNIGMALKHELGEEGYSLWHEWASGSTKFVESDLKKRWTSFRGDGIRIATLFHLAIRGGFRFKEKINFDSVIKPIDVLSNILNMKRNGIYKGVDPCIGNLGKYIHIRKKELIITTGYAGQGKSELIDSIAYKLMKEYNWKFLYCSMEKEVEDHVEAFVHKMAGKPIEETSEEEITRHIKFINNNCSMIDGASFNCNIDNIAELAEMYKRVQGLDCIVIDPFNYIFSKYEMGSYQHTNYVTQKCVRMAKDLNVTVILVAHPKTPSNAFLKDKINQKTGERIKDELPRLTMQSLAGGSNFANVPDIILGVYRKGETCGTEVDIMKVRKQKIDKVGQVHLEFDKNTWMHRAESLMDF